jgi:outer membrane biosynthesis protein TonB
MSVDIREQYAYLKPQPLVWLSILGSAGLHLGLVAALVVGGILQETAKPARDTVIITRLLKKGEERPKHQLPHKDVPRPPAPPPPAPAPAVAPRPEASPAPRPEPRPRQPAPADYSKDQRSALDALEQEVKKTQYAQDGHPDGDPDGDSDEVALGNLYLTKMHQAVKRNYSVPELIPEKERLFLRAVVILRLEPNGQIKDLRFETRSGNDLYDSAVEAAIRRAAPFEAPPKELSARYARDGIGIPFQASKM